MGTYVEKYYKMDTLADDLIYANQLREGMCVLVEDDNKRRDPGTCPSVGSQEWLHALKQYNRWTMVTNLHREDNGIYFIGLYENGEKKSLVCDGLTTWYVKKNSMPRKNETFQECEFWDEECNGEMMTEPFFDVAPHKRVVCGYHMLRHFALETVKEILGQQTKGDRRCENETDSKKFCTGEVLDWYFFPDDRTKLRFCVGHGETRGLGRDRVGFLPDGTVGTYWTSGEMGASDWIHALLEREKINKLGGLIDKDRAENPQVNVKPPFMGEFEGHDV